MLSFQVVLAQEDSTRSTDHMYIRPYIRLRMQYMETHARASADGVRRVATRCLRDSVQFAPETVCDF